MSIRLLRLGGLYVGGSARLPQGSVRPMSLTRSASHAQPRVPPGPRGGATRAVLRAVRPQGSVGEHQVSRLARLQADRPVRQPYVDGRAVGGRYGDLQLSAFQAQSYAPVPLVAQREAVGRQLGQRHRVEPEGTPTGLQPRQSPLNEV